MAPFDGRPTLPSGDEHALIAVDEVAVLAASARGLNVTTIAELLGQSPECVRHLLETAVVKLGARSKLEAVVIALRRGLIDLQNC